MTELNAKNARMMSMLGQRGSIFGLALPEIAASNDKLRVLTADLGLLSGLGKFQSQYPDKLINMGIAEQNMLGVAAGLAKEGNCVFVTTYATFLSMRAFEQIRNNLGYMGFNVKAVGSSAGLAMGMSGNTHYTLEDLAIMRSIPNLTVLSPADAGQAYKMAHAVAAIDQPVYLRLTGGLNCPVVYKEEFDFAIGRAISLRQGQDVAIVATGTMVSESLKVASLLAEAGLQASVVDMHTLKPLDTAVLDAVFASHPAVVTVEEHSIIGGLGGAVAEYKAALPDAPPLLRLGLPDAFFKPAEQGYLLEQCGLVAPTMAVTIGEFLDKI